LFAEPEVSAYGCETRTRILLLVDEGVIDADKPVSANVLVVEVVSVA